MRVHIPEQPTERILRWAPRILFTLALLSLGYCMFQVAVSWTYQRHAKTELKQIVPQQEIMAEAPTAPLESGALIGQIDVDRLHVSVAIVEGAETETLERAAGHIPGTTMPGSPGNIGIAAHRDTFFRPIRNIRTGDVIRLKTHEGEFLYSVVSTRIVDPDDVSVLESGSLQSGAPEVLTLVTCYPFYFVGPAPQRFIVRAERQLDTATTASALAP